MLPITKLSLLQSIEEFDIWITPTLGEISDTQKFKDELSTIVFIFDALQIATDNFKSEDACAPENIANTLTEMLKEKDIDQREKILYSLASALFIVTGKSDNNFKCQFPIYLRDKANWTEIPKVMRREKQVEITYRKIPRTLKSYDFMNIVAQVNDKNIETVLLSHIIGFLLNSEQSMHQFWSIGKSYTMMKSFDRHKDLLSPLVVFKVRGSVMASSGHEPENILRTRMEEWGMRSKIDFNAIDVVVSKDTGNPDRKTRAYDFVLPYCTETWPDYWRKRIFIQCQFYAGDSGSVSHKNVDQTSTSRRHVKDFVDDAVFLEYVDGAGYFSSLNGDLKKLMNYEDTLDWFQIRSASIRLRRRLQKIGFLCPLDVALKVAQESDSLVSLCSSLTQDGYESLEVERATLLAQQTGWIYESEGNIYVNDGKRDLVRRYQILDCIASNGRKIDTSTVKGSIIVPGYGAFYGIELDELIDLFDEWAPSMKNEIENSKILMGDIKWLVEQGMAMTR